MFDLRPILAAAAAGLLLACSPQEGYERMLKERAKKEGEPTTPRDEEALRSVVQESANSEVVLAMVKNYPSPDPQITTETWLARHLHDQPGQIMFARWGGLRRGANKYDVTFTYTEIGADNRMVKRGMMWSADTVLKVVSAPRDLPKEDRIGRGPSDRTDAEESRIRKAEATLE
jgi:hypothetical protein